MAQGGDSNSFLPRILSIFYAVFDVRHGPKIVCQVPEGLIVTSQILPSVPPTPSTETPPPMSSPERPTLPSRSSSTSLASPAEPYSGRSFHSPQKRPPSSSRVLFNFDDISKYIIPPSALCGKLVRCHTQRHRVISLPMELKSSSRRYQRNYFRFNICFVFERSADVSCYEPIVRKVSRVLTACEEESGFLSSPNSAMAMQMACEQIYEDLNTYAETSIFVDQFNSIELKSFPFFPNPPPVKDWMVPVPLINLSKRIEDNWDLTVAKVSRFIDGVNHVSKIAALADCDIDLARDAISHLLYYQVILTIDIFQYSNMYTARKSIQWLADEPHVKEECGPYVTRPGRNVPDWPTLLHLYSRLKPGKAVSEWMQEHNVHESGIDVRRFTSFGVIKGFLRRVHRWPVLLPTSDSFNPAEDVVKSTDDNQFGALYSRRNRIQSFSEAPLKFPTLITPASPAERPIAPLTVTGSYQLLRGRSQSATSSPSLATSIPNTPATAFNVASAAYRARRMSAAERVLEQLRSRDIQRSGAPGISSPRTTWLHHPREEAFDETALESPLGITLTQDDGSRTAIEYSQRSRRQTMLSGSASATASPQLLKTSLAPPIRPRLSRSPSAPQVARHRPLETQIAFPAGLISLLDGDHHTDELCVKYNVGWPVLEQWLVQAGGGSGSGDGDSGRCSMIYR